MLQAYLYVCFYALYFQVTIFSVMSVFLVNIGPTAKRHLNGVSLLGR